MNRKAWIALCTAASIISLSGASILSTPLAEAATTSPSHPLLKFGDRGTAVETLQEDLNTAGYNVGKPDGIFGQGTKDGVLKLQKDHHLQADGIVGASTWNALLSALGPTTSDLHASSIYFNAKLVTSPQAFAWHQTTYMPIYYVMQLLKTIDITSKWDGTHWVLTTPDNMKPDLSGLPVNKPNPGEKEILLNGTPVAYVDGIVFPDPASGVNTTYMPIWYVMQALNHLQFKTKWNGEKWLLTKAETYFAYDKTGEKLGGPFQNETDAEALLKQVPGGTVRDETGATQFTEPDFTAYKKDGKTVLGEFTTLAPAQALVTNLPGGFVEDVNSKVVYTTPDFTAYQKDGTTVIGDFTMQAAAQAAVANVAGGIVKDSAGKVVYTAPDFTAYQKDGKTVIGDFLTQAEAQAAVSNVPGGIVKDATGKVLFTTPDFTAYQKSGAVIGEYTTLVAAQTALSNAPGGTVKNGTAQVVYTAPDFRAFTSPVRSPADFANLAQATAAVASSSIGFVVDASSNKVVYGPQNYNYVDSSGSWRNSQTGWLGAAPSFAKPGNKYVSVSTSSTQPPQFFLISQADGSYVGALVGTYQNPFQTTDLRFPAPGTVTAQQIDQWFQKYNSPLAGLGQSFLMAQAKYGVDATYLVAHAVHETGWGKSSIAQAKNNLFGYGAYDANPAHDAGMFPTDDYAIRYEAWAVRSNYLEPSGPYYDGPTLNGMNVHYASDPLWAQKIATLMSEFVGDTNGNANQYTQFNPSNNAPIPAVSQEPVYLVQGAQGAIMQNPYGALPVWSDPTTGGAQMFPGTLQYGDAGRGVRLLQEALINSDLRPDGQFGPLTQSAVKLWQQSHGLPVTGICDLPTWLSLFPAPPLSIPENTNVVIDQMRQGLEGNLVTLWYHVTSPTGVSGWVDSNYVSPQVQNPGGNPMINMFRVAPATGTMVPVYADETGGGQPATILHVGDEVVTTTLFPVGAPVAPDAKGYIPIYWVNQLTGQRMVGYLKAATVQLTPLTPPDNVTTGGLS